MSVLPDWMIEQLNNDENQGLEIFPFANNQERKGIISYGLSSYGYDIRVGNRFLICKPQKDAVIDPKNFREDLFEEIRVGNYIDIPANGFALARSVEYLRIPRECIGLCIGKSTLARCGINVNITPLEPEWEGNLTIEISNTAPLPVRIYVNEGIAQLLFIKGVFLCQTSYEDKNGKYQNQVGITLPKVEQ